jgi:hypothetical protein
MSICKIKKIGDQSIVSLCIQNHIINDNNKKDVVLVFDKSTSISTKIDFENLKLSIIHLICRLFNSCNITLVVFAGNRYTKLDVDSLELEFDKDYYDYNIYKSSKISNIIQKLLKVKNIGNTNMVKLFNNLENVVDDLEKDKEVSFVFFTDCFDTVSNSNEDIIKSIDSFNNVLSSKTNNYRFHNVCTNTDYNIDIINYLISKSVSYGSSTCVENLLQMHQKINYLTDKIINTSYNISIVDNDKKYVIPQTEIFSITNGNLQVNTILNNISPNSFVKLKLENSNELKYDLVEDVSNNLDILSDNLWRLFEYGYIKNAKNIMNISHKKISINTCIEKLNNFIVSMDNQVNTYFSRVINDVNDRTTHYLGIYKNMRTNMDILVKYKKMLVEVEFDKIDFNELLENVYISMYGLRLRSKVSKFDNSLTKLSDKVKGEDFSSFSEDKKNNIIKITNQFITDIYPSSNIINLLENKDCVCIGLHINKDERLLSEVNDFNCIEILPIKTNFKTYYMLNKSLDDDNIRKFYNLDKSINMICPIFIYEQHWNTASQWFELLDQANFMGLTKKEIIAIPFLALGKMIIKYHQNKTDENKSLYNLLLNTCKKIMIDMSDDRIYNAVDNIMTKYDRYTKVQTGRIYPVVNNNLLFVIYIYVMIKLNKISPMDKVSSIKFARIMAEEEARRNQVSHSNKQFNEEIFSKLLGLKMEDVKDQDILEKLPEVKDNTSPYTVLMKKLLDKNDVEIKISDDIRLSKTSELSKAFIDKTINNYNRYARVPIEMIKYCMDEKLHDSWSSDLNTLGLDTIEKNITFSIQNYVFNEDTQSMGSLMRNEHIDPFDKDQVSIFIKGSVLKCVKYLRNKSIDNARKNFVSTDIKERVNTFINTPDELEAAGALYSLSIKDVKKFLEPLQDKECHLSLSKIKMIIKGKYKNISLYSDHNDRLNLEPEECYKFWKVNNRKLQKWEWADLFDHIRNHVWAWYSHQQNTQPNRHPLCNPNNII